MHRILLSGILIALTLPSPAMAQSVSVPEPNDLALFALGVVGLVVGRHVARRRD